MTAATQKSPDAQMVDPALAENLDELTALASEIGAEGVWLVRGVKNAALIYTPPESIATDIPNIKINLDLRLDLAGAGVLVIMRFPASDGREVGLEKR